MGEPALNFSTNNNDKTQNQSLKHKIKETHTDELIIGLCGPIGTDIHFVSENLKKIIEESFNYECQIIKLSDFIKHHTNFEESAKDYNYYHTLIDNGNKLREQHQNSILAELAINEIAVKRELLKGDDDEYRSHRTCFIIDSIKNKEELEIFRLIYRDIFYFFGIFSPLDKRVSFLENKGISSSDVYKLIDRDSGEEISNGQKVSDTFIESDFFIRIENSNSNSVEAKLRRFLNLIFSTEIITPSTNETAMYSATAAAGNSACLSRQVGAAITDIDGELISLGWNDVPKSGGGVYQFNDDDLLNSNDNRCLNQEGGICFNDKEKDTISNALVKELIDKKVIDSSKKAEAIKVIKKSRIKELIEFSRAVHAEMLAIIVGSQKAGDRVKNGKLFCTTYPCHNCARHIIAAGIKEVYYIEPYRKSLAIKLHSDSITEDEAKTDLVRIMMYEGVAPRRYLDFFKMLPNSRKSDGKKITSSNKLKNPKNTLSLHAIPLLEKKVTENLKHKNLIDV